MISKNSNALSSSYSNNEEELQKLRPESEIKTKEEAVAQLKLAEKLKQVLATKLKRQDNKNNEVLMLREKNVEIQKEIVVYQEALNKIKAYFLGMEEAGLIKYCWLKCSEQGLGLI